jgi:hypothetical protein
MGIRQQFRSAFVVGHGELVDRRIDPARRAKHRTEPRWGAAASRLPPRVSHHHTRKLRGHHTEDRCDASRATGGAFEISPFDCRNTHARASNPVQRTARIQSRRRPHAAPSSNASVTAAYSLTPMSTLGQSGHMQCKKPCPLYPRKRTCAVQLGMSALGQ